MTFHRRIIFFLALFLLPFALRADIAIEGEVDVRFKVLNVADFPDYAFHYMYVGHHYNMGYQASAPVLRVIEGDEECITSDRSKRSFIYARLKKGKKDKIKKSPVFISEKGLGGQMIVDDHKTEYVLLSVKILSVEDEKVNFEVVDTERVYRDGTRMSVKKGSMITGIEIFGIDIAFLVLPLACLLGLIFFFRFRRKQGAAAA